MSEQPPVPTLIKPEALAHLIDTATDLAMAFTAFGAEVAKLVLCGPLGYSAADEAAQVLVEHTGRHRADEGPQRGSEGY